jgi:hypothetical protein
MCFTSKNFKCKRHLSVHWRHPPPPFPTPFSRHSGARFKNINASYTHIEKRITSQRGGRGERKKHYGPPPPLTKLETKHNKKPFEGIIPPLPPPSTPPPPHYWKSVSMVPVLCMAKRSLSLRTSLQEYFGRTSSKKQVLAVGHWPSPLSLSLPRVLLMRRG